MKDGEPKPIDPTLLECQTAFKALSDKILSHKTNPRLSFFNFKIETDPASVVDRINRSSLADLMLKNGDSLSAPDLNTHYPNLGLVVGETPLLKVDISHGDWTWDKTRQILNDPPTTPPYRVIEYPGEVDWQREIAIRIWYGTEAKNAYQALIVSMTSERAGEMPWVGRNVYSLQYAETGYEGHNAHSRPFRDQEEGNFFVNLAHELFMKRELAEGEWEELEKRMIPDERLWRVIIRGDKGPTIEELRARPADYVAQQKRRELATSAGEPEDTLLTTEELEAKSRQKTDEMMRGIVDEVFAPLDETERRVFDLRYGIMESSGMTLAEVGRKIGKSRWAVGRIEKKARVKLQPYFEKWRQEQAEEEARFKEKFGSLGSAQ